jgi:uncharacterized protein (DUF2062 family)
VTGWVTTSSSPPYKKIAVSLTALVTDLKKKINLNSFPYALRPIYKSMIQHCGVGTVYPVGVSHTSAVPVHHNWIYRRGVLPILALLRMGATPRRLAWSIAAGLLIGLNPVIGTTTLMCLAAAGCFRLNVVASQIANHAMFPLELALVIPFLRLGSRVFHTAAMPLSPSLFLHEVRSAPIALTRQLWLWEWHAVVVWSAVAVVFTPLIALALTPVLRRMLTRIQHHEYPIVSTLVD